MQPPKPCTGAHQRGCDLEGVEGATPHTSLTQLTFKTMTHFKEQNTQLIDDQLEAITGGMGGAARLGRVAGEQVKQMLEERRRNYINRQIERRRRVSS